MYIKLDNAIVNIRVSTNLTMAFAHESCLDSTQLPTMLSESPPVLARLERVGSTMSRIINVERFSFNFPNYTPNLISTITNLHRTLLPLLSRALHFSKSTTALNHKYPSPIRIATLHTDMEISMKYYLVDEVQRIKTSKSFFLDYCDGLYCCQESRQSVQQLTLLSPRL